jgi:hypothetical protein
MTKNEIMRRFPNASEAFIRANLSIDVALSDSKQCERSEALAGRNAGETCCTGLRHCRFTLCRKKLLDVDAKYASVKDLLDCLAIAGIIRGDKEGEITLEVNQQKCSKGKPEETMIEVFL